MHQIKTYKFITVQTLLNLSFTVGKTYIYCCLDVDECMIGSDNCHRDAKCTNTEGSWECSCNQGLTGDGVDCTGMFPCRVKFDHL